MTPKKKTTKKTAKKKRKGEFDFEPIGKFMGMDVGISNDVTDWSMMRTPFSNAVTTSRFDAQPLNAQQIAEAMDTIMRHMDNGHMTILQTMLKHTGARDVNELLEIMFAMVQVFDVRTKPGMAARYGENITLSMRLPLGRHTQTLNTLASVSMAEKEHARMDRHYTYIDMFNRMMDPMIKWIDIAENAKTNMSFKEILAIENIEQRRAALRIFGEERLLEESGAVLLDTGTHDQQLYVIPEDIGAFDTAAFFLKYNCPSTGRLYVSGVDPSLFINTHVRWRPDSFRRTPLDSTDREWRHTTHNGWADKAMAWKFHMTPEEYSRMHPANQA